MKCNETLGKWCKNKHGASKIIDTLETYQGLLREGKKVCAGHRVDDFSFGGFRDQYDADFFDSGHKWICASA
jgi:hypothetical protein